MEPSRINIPSFRIALFCEKNFATSLSDKAGGGGGNPCYNFDQINIFVSKGILLFLPNCMIITFLLIEFRDPNTGFSPN